MPAHYYTTTVLEHEGQQYITHNFVSIDEIIAYAHETFNIETENIRLEFFSRWGTWTRMADKRVLDRIIHEGLPVIINQNRILIRVSDSETETIDRSSD